MADYSKFSTILFMDSMVALEGEPLAKLPWAEVDTVGPILILVVPQVGREIDSKKRDGRLAKKARDFNRLIAPAIQNGEPTRICEGKPDVFLDTAVCGRVNWDELDDLDPDQGDARVVAEILNARDVEFGKRTLLTHDINPMAMATRHKLRSFRMPDHWLQEPEPSPDEKEKKKLRERVAQLEATEPRLELKLKFDSLNPFTVCSTAPISESQQHELAGRIVRNNLPQAQNSGVMDRDYTYSRRHTKWASKTVPEYTRQLKRILETFYNQIEFEVSLNNVGSVHAEHLVLSLRAVGGTLHDRFSMYPLGGPPPPELRHPSPYIPPFIHNVPHLHDRHEMHFGHEPDRTQIIEWRCGDFRQSRKWKFRGVITFDPSCASSPKLIATLTTANMKGALSEICDLPIVVSQTTVEELFDLSELKLLKEFPLKEKVLETIASGDTTWIHVLSTDEEEDE